MKVLVFGSANIDRTYQVHHFVDAMETISADKMESFCGGKGFNQAIAFARAGSDVYFAGAVGNDGKILVDTLKDEGINIDHLKETSEPSGHAIIQVTPDGQNSIIILAGANASIAHEDVDRVLASFGKGTLVVLQNEISSVDYIIERAKKREMLIALNPSPFNEKIGTYDLSKVDFMLLNEVEAALLTGCSEIEIMADTVHKEYPDVNIVLTLGSKGSVFVSKNGDAFTSGIFQIDAVDTTAAGDTYTGYFLSEILKTGNAETALRNATIASGLAVSCNGASQSIPKLNEVEEIRNSELTEFSNSLSKEEGNE